jgi:hypothetical protein
VNVQLRDRAGNIRRWIYDSIILDTIAPTGSIVINGGDAVTNTREVTIDLSAFDALSGVTEMRFSVNKTDDASFGDWQPFTSQKPLTLPDYPGTNYVNVHFRDAAGNIRRWVWDSITLETTEETPPA